MQFFSQEKEGLGTKISLKQQIHEITHIPVTALRGTPLSQFSIEDRLQWAAERDVKKAEDKAYCLLGIFGISMSLRYGEGDDALKRLREKLGESKNDQNCLIDLWVTDPRDDKTRIEQTKSGLLQDSYRWILDHPKLREWRDNPKRPLLCIRADPGKGKTMLLCGIIDELRKSPNVCLLSFFFCQATDRRINNATAVLRGLIYLLIDQQPSLVSHVRKKYDHSGKSIFKDVNSWVTLSDIFKNILLDLKLETAYLVIDALDECVTDLPKLLDLISDTSSSSKVKWLLSGRNELLIEQKLGCTNDQRILSLKLKKNAEHVSEAINVFIDTKLKEIKTLQDETLKHQVRGILRRKAEGTFLWIALAIKELEDPERLDPLQVVEDAPTGLYQLYDLMMDRIQRLKRYSEHCLLMLSTVTVAYRPLYLADIHSLCQLSDNIAARDIVAMCGSFLTIRDDQVYIIHQSAKDYLSGKARTTGFPTEEETHHKTFTISLKLMPKILQRDMYNLKLPGFPINQVQVPDPDPLVTVRYSCIHWIDHLCASDARTRHDDLNGTSIYTFLQEWCLYWLEALSLCRSMSDGVASITKLEALVKVMPRSAISLLYTIY